MPLFAITSLTGINFFGLLMIASSGMSPFGVIAALSTKTKEKWRDKISRASSFYNRLTNTFLFYTTACKLLHEYFQTLVSSIIV